MPRMTTHSERFSCCPCGGAQSPRCNDHASDEHGLRGSAFPRQDCSPACPHSRRCCRIGAPGVQTDRSAQLNCACPDLSEPYRTHAGPTRVFVRGLIRCISAARNTKYSGIVLALGRLPTAGMAELRPSPIEAPARARRAWRRAVSYPALSACPTQGRQQARIGTQDRSAGQHRLRPGSSVTRTGIAGHQ
jgi:hypothetical protein